MIPIDLRVRMLSEPLGVDANPVFSWKVETDARDVTLSAAFITLRDANGRTFWESGWVDTPSTPAVSYTGRALAPRTRYTWTVRVRDAARVESDESHVASFETGILGGTLGDAQWIRLDEATPHGVAAPVQYLRTEFDVSAPVVRARLLSTALGWYRVFINGEDVLGPGIYPGFTAFEARVEYQVRDVGHAIHTGRNAIGVTLSDGRFRGRIGALGTPAMYGERTAAIALLELEHADGSRATVHTDGSWSGGHGDIVTSDPRAGEVIDARLRGPWSRVGGTFPQSVPVTAVDEHRTLVGASADELRHNDPIAPIGAMTAPSGKLIVDFGQNLHGATRVRVRGPRGSELVVAHSEVLVDGEVDTSYLFGGMPVDVHIGPNRFILSGGDDDFLATFSTQGFRYLSVEHPADVEFLGFEAVPIHAALDFHGRFRSANALVNRFHDNVVWSMRGNFLDVPTDCPTRERSGWTGDAQVFAPAALLLADSGAYLRNWLADMRAQQHADGTITDIVPLDSPNWREGAEPVEMAPGVPMPPSGSAGWGDAIVLIPWEIYTATGDTEVLVENFAAMSRWIERYARLAAEAGSDGPNNAYLVESGYHWGEWLEPAGEGDGTLELSSLIGDLTEHSRSWVATAYFEHSSRVVAQIASILGRDADAAHFAEYADGARAAWQSAYMGDAGRLEPDAQATYVRALEFDLVPRDRRAATLERLVERIRNRDTHLATGFLSTGFLLRQLSQNGAGDVALDLLLQESAPSWLGQVVRGATTVWETWTGHDDKGSPMLSHNHYSLGGSVRWLYENLAGMRPVEPGWRRFEVDPLITARIGAVAASTGTPFGEASVQWQLDGRHVTLSVVVPAGAEADVVLAGADLSTAEHNGVPVPVDTDMRVPRIAVGSGRHEFSWQTAE